MAKEYRYVKELPNTVMGRTIKALLRNITNQTGQDQDQLLAESVQMGELLYGENEEEV